MAWCPVMGRVANRDLLLVVLFLCRTIVCDSRCPKFAEKPLETRVQDASIVFRAVVVQTHFQSKTLDLALVSIYRGGVELASISQYAGSPYNTTDSTQPAATTNNIAQVKQPQTFNFADSQNSIKPCTSKTFAINQLDPQPQPSTSAIQLESIPNILGPRDLLHFDFSDDDSVADPIYVPNSDFDESTISDILDISKDVFNSDNTLNCIDNLSLEQNTQERILDNAIGNISENSKQIFIAEYPGPIYITNSLTNHNIYKNKNMLKHPMIQRSCVGKCRRRCLELSYQDRLAIWEQYWNAKFQKRRGFLNKFVQFSEIKRRKVNTNQSTTNPSTSKNETRHYYMPGKDKDLIPVCKRFFLDTLGLRTDGVITELSKAVRKGQLFASMTGENRGGKRKEINRNLIQKHILGYNPAVSHYRRHNSPFTRYLPRELTVRQMHLDFMKKYPQERCSDETYRKEIKKMKISFNMPRGDKCDECFLYSEEKKKYSDESQIPDDIKQKYAVHKAKSDQAFENYKNDATKKNSTHVKYFSMDLQKVILLPIMPQIKEAVFISRLITFNLTFAPINKQSPDPATCIIWHEGQAGREASNIVDAILTFMKNDRDCQHFHIWADNCTAQNKNWTLFTALTTIVNIDLPVETVTLSCLTKGHTHMTADSVHGNIERKIKRQGDVLDFEDFKEVVLHSRQKIQVRELNNCRNWPKKKRTARKNDDEDLMKSFLLSQVVQVKFIAGSRNILYKTRQVNLKTTPQLGPCFNWSMAPSQSELVVFARISDPAVDLETTPPDGPWLEATSAAVPWSLGVDIAIWNAVGWAGWGEWGSCSRTCGGGRQTRRRYCSKATCEGYGEQARVCNSFDCKGAINPLAPGARRNFHPAQARWGPVADRPHAFSLRPNSYIWIASSELFGAGKTFPREFTLFISLRLRPESGGYGQGTLFSLRSRRRTGSFLSLELAGRGAARLVHAGAGSSRSIYLAVPLYDFRWHHIAISVHDDNTVRAYVDCRWLRTDVLEKDALDTPRDADLIIGYLFSGDLEQLVLVPKAGQAHQQCSSQYSGVSNPSVTTNVT